MEPMIGKNNMNFYVGKGNNYYLVRQIIKRRVWWTRASKEEFGPYVNKDDQPCTGCNFIWTQWRKTKHIEHLKQNKSDTIKLYNRLDDNFHLSNKKALFRNIVTYFAA